MHNVKTEEDDERRNKGHTEIMRAIYRRACSDLTPTIAHPSQSRASSVDHISCVCDYHVRVRVSPVVL